MELNTTNPHCFTYKTEEILIELLGGVRVDGLDYNTPLKSDQPVS